MLTAVAVVVLLVSGVLFLINGRLKAARRVGLFVATLVVVYSGALVITGLVSTPLQLHPGDTKCFDDWCARMSGARRESSGSHVVVDVQLENRGRGRAMKSNLARAYIEGPSGGSLAPDDGTGMQSVIEAGGRVDIQLTFEGADAMRGVRFVVAEGPDGVGPGTFTIGDEVSPFHARASWPLPVS